MNLLKTIFLFEYRQFKRQPVILYSLLIFLAVSFYASYSGRVVIQKQLTVIDSLDRSYKKDLASAIEAFTDTSTAAKKAQSKYAGQPQVIDYKLPQNTVNYPKALAGLAIGVRDISPFYDKVKKDIQFLQPITEFTNPALLYEGNFDLSFVFIFLLPLLIISFCYNILSAERETGTYSLLVLQGANINRITIGKLLFRLAVVLATILITSITGFIIAASTLPFFTDIVLWFFAMIAYVCFWFSVCYAVVVSTRTSAASALNLLAGWLVFLVLMPSLTNTYINMKHPVPLRADLADYERHVDWEVWFIRPKLLIDTFNRNHPEYLKSYVPKTDTTNQSKRFFAAYFEAKERRVVKYSSILDEDIMSGNRAVDKLSAFIPVLKMQHLLNTIAGTSLNDQRSFRDQTASFQRLWNKFVYGAEFSGKLFKPEELDTLPKFKVSQAPVDAALILEGSLTLWLSSLLILAYALIKTKKLN